MKPIRFGILGAARIAENRLVPSMRDAAGAEFVAVASRSLEKAQAFAEKNAIAQAYGRYEELLADPTIDAIYNPLPVSMHEEWSIRAADAGKAVLCEKPLSGTADSAQHMFDAFRDRKILLSEALMFRYHPMVQKVLQLIQEGAIGRSTIMHAVFNASIDDETNIRYYKELGGGALLDVGSYCVSVLRYLAGEEPSTVQASAELTGADGVDLNMAGCFRFPSGVVAHFGCGIGTQFHCAYGADGTEGRLLVDGAGMAAWPGHNFVIKHWRGTDYTEYPIAAADSYKLMIEDFCQSLRTGAPMLLTEKDSVNNLRVIDRLFAAL